MSELIFKAIGMVESIRFAKQHCEAEDCFAYIAEGYIQADYIDSRK